MKRYVPFIFLLSFFQFQRGHSLYAQDDAPRMLFRIYEDNDFMNIRGTGTDNAYTNGTSLDLFLIKQKPSRFIVDRLMPKAGDSSIDVFAWSLVQLIFTPDDLSIPYYQPDDYPYSAALYVKHALYSYNPIKKYDLQTELVLGVMGPMALGQQTQTLIHQIMQFVPPKGWANQRGNAPLVNINFAAEKQFFGYRDIVEVIGGTQAYFGTMMNGLSVYPLLRIGKMNGYFNGFISQYSSVGEAGYKKKKHQWQAYVVVKPQAQLVITNALLQGGVFAKNPEIPSSKSTQEMVLYGSVPAAPSSGGINHFDAALDYGAVLAYGNFSISYTQKPVTAYMKNLYSHSVGNVSVYYSW